MIAIAQIMRAESPLSMPRIIRNPTPDLAPTISAANTHIQPAPRAVFKPAKIAGVAPGMIISRKIRMSLAFITRAAFISSGSTSFTPVWVFNTTGMNAPINTINIFGDSSIPSQRITNGIHAMGGIGRSSSNMGSTTA